MKIIKEKNTNLDDIPYRTVLASVAWHMSSGGYDFLSDFFTFAIQYLYDYYTTKIASLFYYNMMKHLNFTV